MYMYTQCQRELVVCFYSICAAFRLRLINECGSFHSFPSLFSLLPSCEYPPSFPYSITPPPPVLFFFFVPFFRKVWVK